MVGPPLGIGDRWQAFSFGVGGPSMVRKLKRNLFEKAQPQRVKPLLYVYRVLLTGIHLMRTGNIEADLVRLNGDFKLPLSPS